MQQFTLVAFISYHATYAYVLFQQRIGLFIQSIMSCLLFVQHLHAMVALSYLALHNVPQAPSKGVSL